MSEPNEEVLRLSNQLCFPLYAAARKVTGLYQPYLQPLGLTYTQYVALLALWEKDMISVSELGERLYLDSGTLTPMLKKLEQRGLLERRRSKDDERVVHVCLTDEGRALKEQAREIPKKVGSCIDLPPEEAAALYQTLYKLLK